MIRVNISKKEIIIYVSLPVETDLLGVSLVGLIFLLLPMNTVSIQFCQPSLLEL